jgi:hypothetical protein
MLRSGDLQVLWIVCYSRIEGSLKRRELDDMFVENQKGIEDFVKAPLEVSIFSKNIRDILTVIQFHQSADTLLGLLDLKLSTNRE